MCMPTVLIMMASYNGEMYIEQQIDSILNQSYKNFLLVIQDDNSTDRTQEIIKKKQLHDKRIVLWDNQGKNGAYENFHSLINKCKEKYDYDYYMFSDHDDIWNSNKIEIFVDEMENNYDQNEPIMLYADMCIIDGNNKITSKSVNKIFNLQYKNKWSTLYNHSIYGCNCIINKKLFYLVPTVKTDDRICHILCHDNYYGKFAAFFGKLRYIDISLMMYRRYSTNVTAKHDYSYGLKKLIMRVKSINDLAESHARTYIQSLYTIEKMKQIDMNINDSIKLEKLAKSIKKGGFSAVYYALKYKISCGILIRTFSRYLILFSKLYLKFLKI